MSDYSRFEITLYDLTGRLMPALVAIDVHYEPCGILVREQEIPARFNKFFPIHRVYEVKRFAVEKPVA